jgi:uncharacterized protein (TIGR03437 family)
MNSRPLLRFILVAGIATMMGCPDESTGPDLSPVLPAPPSSPPAVVPDPIVTGIDPASAEPGQEVVISGSHFGTDRLRLKVTFGGNDAFVRFVSDTSITAQVPYLVGLGAVPVLVSVTGAAHGATTSLDVRQGTPVINFFHPFTAADPGATISVNGRNFGSQKDQVTVTFGSVAGSVVSVINTRIDVVVPSATPPGNAVVVVTVGERTSLPALLMIRPPSPKISAVGPSPALRGSDIIVFGSHFGLDRGRVTAQFCQSTPDSYYYYYAGVDCTTATVSEVFDTRMTVHVPDDLAPGNWELLITVTDASQPATANVQIL